MIEQVRLPRLGETMDEAEIACWLVAVGETVRKGDVLLEITTDKATLEVESPAAGTLRSILAEPGRVVPVGGVIALIGEPSDVLPTVTVAYPRSGQPGAAGAPPDARAQTPVSPLSGFRVSGNETVAQPPVAGRRTISPRARRAARRLDVPVDLLRGSGPGGRIIERDVLTYASEIEHQDVSPAARRLAAQRGIHLGRVLGTGPRGRITRSDVEQTGPSVEEVPQPLAPMRRLAAERMTLAKREIPHYYLMMDVDMTAASAYRASWNAAGTTRLSFSDLVLRAAALAAREVPEALARWTDHGIIPVQRVHLGLAVALDTGLIVPVVRDADRLNLVALARATAALVEKARSKRLLPEETEGACLTLTNLGMHGVDRFLPIIVPGQSAILGAGRIAPTPVVRDGAVAVREMMCLSLAADHRVADGAVGARFLAAVRLHLEEVAQWPAIPTT
jgi:pyruvate dehydrogenase E2 component (dihydrolipoamide acetyltransferase)